MPIISRVINTSTSLGLGWYSVNGRRREVTGVARPGLRPGDRVRPSSFVRLPGRLSQRPENREPVDLVVARGRIHSVCGNRGNLQRKRVATGKFRGKKTTEAWHLRAKRATGRFLARQVDLLEAVSKVVRGNESNNYLVGTKHNDTIRAFAGDDIVSAMQGDDKVRLGRGNDDGFGGPGDDDLKGGKGSDKIYAGSGHDTVDGGSGHDKIRGGAGNDIIVSGAGKDVVRGGAGEDVFVTLNGGRGYVTVKDMEEGDVLEFCGCPNTTLRQVDNGVFVEKGTGDWIDIKAFLEGVAVEDLSMDFNTSKIEIVPDLDHGN